uniref:Chorismate lyase n=1 Tax=Bostrychia tenella TaxID=324755 RepID=A0A1Z1M5J8_9FLOR|nr:hypothetical protein [Bostrychia tenella]ARW61190.1 hypothetical protein [Bostrychia tenella]
MSINTFCKFHAICIIPKYKIKCLKNKSSRLMPNKWQLILMSEGSLTKNLNYLTSKITKIGVLQQKNSKNQVINRTIRCVWLETCIYTKLTFARSLWILINTNKPYNLINPNKPIGSSFIEYKIDTYKDIHEVYYGYCQNLEKNFPFPKTIWGRKYTLYYANKSSVIIQEFFSPYITYFF